MIQCTDMYNIVKQNNIEFFAGVPDSVFKEWLKYLDHEYTGKHVAASNECDAIALVAGYYLATGKIGVAYMQNSGLCNALNPLTSLADKEVYSIPMILLIGWRGMPGVHDKPQHVKMGRITLPLLETLEIPYIIPEATKESMADAWKIASETAIKNSEPYAIILKKGLFEKYNAPSKDASYTMTREEALEIILQHAPKDSAFVSTTGFMSRELYELRDRKKESHSVDFYTVGSMGCTISIATGIAMANEKKSVVALDADGAALMHLGAWAPLGHSNLSNLHHILIDNSCYESTGEQPTHSNHVDFCKIAQAIGYKNAKSVTTKTELQDEIQHFFSEEGPHLLVLHVKTGVRPDLGRPKTKPVDNKIAFMEFLQK